MNSIQNALYRNFGQHNVNMNTFENYYYNRNVPRNKLRNLSNSLKRYKRKIGYSPSLNSIIKNIDSSLNKTKKQQTVTRENLLKARSRLKRKFPNTATVPFSQKNIPGHIGRGYRKLPFRIKNKKLRTVSPQKNKNKLASIALRSIVSSGSGKNVPWNVLPKGSIRSSIKGKITPANVRVGMTNLRMVREFKNYMNLVKTAREVATSQGNHENLEELLKRNLNNYHRKKFGLDSKAGQMLYSSILRILYVNNPKQPFLQKMKSKYNKYGFFGAKNIWRLLRSMKKSAKIKKT
jgi:hypothetical protein